MKEDKQKVKKAEAEITLASLKSEAKEVANELTDKYAELFLLKERIKEATKELGSVQKEAFARLADVDTRELSLKERERKIESREKRAKEELHVIKKQTSEAMRELKMNNEWVFSAREERDNIKEDIKKLNEEVKQKEDYITDIAIFKEKREVAEKNYQAVLIETRLAKEDAEAKKVSAEGACQNAEQSLKIATEKRVEEEQKLLDAINRRKKIEKDLEIYIKRVEKEYEKVFPGRKMKLT